MLPFSEVGVPAHRGAAALLRCAAHAGGAQDDVGRVRLPDPLRVLVLRQPEPAARAVVVGRGWGLWGIARGL